LPSHPNVQRATSFPAQSSAYAQPGGVHGAPMGGPGSAAGYPMMGSQRHVSPSRQPQGSAVFTPQMSNVPNARPQQPPMSHAAAAPPNLDVSQRMQRANDLMQRLIGAGAAPPGPASPSPAAAAAGQMPGGGPQASPLPFNLNTPNLLNWAREQHAQHGQARGVADSFEPQRSCPSMGACGACGGGDVDPLDFGLSTLHNLPPPPRSAPAAEASPPAGGGYGGGGGGGGGGGQGPFSLTVLTSDSRWETLSFYSGDNLDQKGSTFLEQKGLKAAFHPGLVTKMRSMITMGQAQSSVDIVDLL